MTVSALPLGVIEMELWLTKKEHLAEGGAEGNHHAFRSAVRVRDISTAREPNENQHKKRWTLIVLAGKEYWVEKPFDEISALMRNA